MRRLDSTVSISAAKVASVIANLQTDPSLEPAIVRATADEESVRARLAIATRAFASA